MLALIVTLAFFADATVTPDMDQADIQAALDGAAAGETVSFKKGRYLLDGALSVDNDGVIVKGSKAVLDGQYIDDCMVVSSNDVTVTGFVFVNGNGHGLRVGDPPTEGPPPPGPDGVTISKNTATLVDGIGIFVRGTNATITGNKASACDDDGIWYDDTGLPGPEGSPTASFTLVSKNTTDGNGGVGLAVETHGRTHVEKNKSFGNGGDGIVVNLFDPAEGPPPAEPSRICKNAAGLNGGDGINANDGDGHGLVVDKNKSNENGEDGIVVVGEGFFGNPTVISGNQTNGNNERGLSLGLNEDGMVTKNKSQRNRLEGLLMTLQVGHGNHVIGNTLKANGRDGILILNGSNNVMGNKCQNNLGDGIDVQNDAFPGQVANNVLDGNTCSGNAHDGVDNAGSDTAITNNKCKKNGGLDIAGTGASGIGTLDDFEGNTFETGGAADAEVLDLNSL